ncbi:6-phosphogluconolactonase [Pedobacter sp. JCM 36344]|uniref:6-phosphogluconolactonase n=1 Tax=Pedobacter sp. JCM 36344 TaxID=3374280 RepID=UPI00397CA759
MSVLIYNNSEELFHDLSEYILNIATQSILEKGAFNFVLTGGNSPKKLYEILATTYKDKIDWSKVFFFFGDERNVMPNHESYNGLMAKRSILEPLEIAEDHIFYLNTALEPDQAAIAYEESIKSHFKGTEIAFDLILLGMGDDAHTASLFPETSILSNTEATIASVYVEKLSTYRISFTAPLINKAKNVAFLVFGESKAEAVQHVLSEEEKNTHLYPSQLIAPINGTLTWFLDEQAAGLIEN